MALFLRKWLGRETDHNSWETGHNSARSGDRPQQLGDRPQKCEDRAQRFGDRARQSQAAPFWTDFKSVLRSGFDRFGFFSENRQAGGSEKMRRLIMLLGRWDCTDSRNYFGFGDFMYSPPNELT
jgi:hypothetical protein